MKIAKLQLKHTHNLSNNTGEQNWPKVLGTLIYKGVNLERGER